MNSLAQDRPARTRHPLHLGGVDDYADREIAVNRISHAVRCSWVGPNCSKATFARRLTKSRTPLILPKGTDPGPTPFELKPLPHDRRPTSCGIANCCCIFRHPMR